MKNWIHVSVMFSAAILLMSPLPAASAATAPSQQGASSGSASTGGLTPEYSSQTANVCATYPNNTQGCHYVRGADLTVGGATARHSTSSTSVCDTTVQWKYTRESGATGTFSIVHAACERFSYDAVWQNPGVFKRGSDFCARIKDSVTGGVYGPWMCARIG